MAITGYTALTAAEFNSLHPLPAHPAWMACHFSCYSTGLTNFPYMLPPGSMVIVNDRTPVQGHSPEKVLEQLTALGEDLKPDCFLLDLQRPDNPQTAQIVSLLADKFPFPIGVSEHYAQSLSCPVFLCAPPVDCALDAHLKPWEGREIWLEIAPDAQTATITASGCSFTPAIIQPLESPASYDRNTCCRYTWELTDDAAVFHLLRDQDALSDILRAAEHHNITRAVGLYQQLGYSFFA